MYAWSAQKPSCASLTFSQSTSPQRQLPIATPLFVAAKSEPQSTKSYSSRSKVVIYQAPQRSRTNTSALLISDPEVQWRTTQHRHPSRRNETQHHSIRQIPLANAEGELQPLAPLMIVLPVKSARQVAIGDDHTARSALIKEEIVPDTRQH